MNRSFFLLRFDFWLLTLTVLYAFLSLTGNGVVLSDNTPVPSMGPALLGLFVPIGPNNLILMLGIFGWFAVAFVGFMLIKGEGFLQKFNLSVPAKILAVAFLLVFTTTVVDLITLFRPMSIMIFLASTGLFPRTW